MWKIEKIRWYLVSHHSTVPAAVILKLLACVQVPFTPLRGLKGSVPHSQSLVSIVSHFLKSSFSQIPILIVEWQKDLAMCIPWGPTSSNYDQSLACDTTIPSATHLENMQPMLTIDTSFYSPYNMYILLAHHNRDFFEYWRKVDTIYDLQYRIRLCHLCVWFPVLLNTVYNIRYRIR